MLREGLNHGFSDREWRDAKNEALQLMIERARSNSTITYSDQVLGIQSISFSPTDRRLFHMLGEIASDEDELGCGLITAVVVQKTGDMMPGKGFFDLAKLRGRNVDDQSECWNKELQLVYGYWADRN